MCSDSRGGKSPIQTLYHDLRWSSKWTKVNYIFNDVINKYIQYCVYYNYCFDAYHFYRWNWTYGVCLSWRGLSHFQVWWELLYWAFDILIMDKFVIPNLHIPVHVLHIWIFKYLNIHSSNAIDTKFDEAVGHIEDIIMGKFIARWMWRIQVRI